MIREEFLKKLQKCYFGERKAFNEIMAIYDKMQKQLEEKDEALKVIRDIAFDYDGFNDVDNLKTLIDDLREIAHRGINSKPIVMTKEQVLERINKNE